jgi:hypothetical protein
MRQLTLKSVTTVVLAITCAFAFMSFAHADDITNRLPAATPSPTPTPAPDSKKKSLNQVEGAEKVDEMITNPNMRAYSGSLSRWSMSNSITYDGGTVDEPFAEGRPNIAGASATSVDTDINDTISLKFSINPVNALLLGFGVRKMAPFTGKGPSQAYYNSGGKDVDAFDPSLTYQYIYKWFGIQSVAQVGLTHYTRQDIQSSQGGNLNNALGFDQENIYEIGRLSIGASIGVGANTPTDSSQDYSKYQWWFDPYVEFKLNDTFNLRTVFNRWTYEYYPISGMTLDAWTQSVGIGCSVTRDIFIYPNLQFLPNSVQKQLTNVGMTATINLF